MRFFFHLYSLNASFMVRKGALLKVIFPDDSIGFADCHPWPELGDAPLKRQLDQLKEGGLTSLTKRSLAFAKMDAEARRQERNLFENLPIPESHTLIFDLSKIDAMPQPKRVKLKVGREIPSELPCLEQIFTNSAPHTRFRLDANQRMDCTTCRSFLKKIERWIYKIDFFEDPMPYVIDDWKAIQNEFSISLASDMQSEKHLTEEYPHRISILKPACQSPEIFIDNHRPMIVTSYLDHPIGQLTAAYTAAKLKEEYPEKVEICGLLTHQVYAANPFSERLCVNEDRLVPCMEGTGFGYDDLLNTLKWEPLARISHKILDEDGQDVAIDLPTMGREHCPSDKARPIGGEDGVTDCSDSPRVCEKCGSECI